MTDFTPDLEAQQKSIEAMLNNPELERQLLEQNPRPISFNEYERIAGGSVADFGKYIIRLRESSEGLTKEEEVTRKNIQVMYENLEADHIIRGEE